MKKVPEYVAIGILAVFIEGIVIAAGIVILIATLIHTVIFPIKNTLVWRLTTRRKRFCLRKITKKWTNYKNDQQIFCPDSLQALIKQFFEDAKQEHVSRWKVRHVLPPELRVFA